jgi:hypothetical protein
MKAQLTQYECLKLIRKPTLGRGPVFKDKTKYNRKQKHKGGW